MADDEITVQQLMEARVHVVRSEPGKIVLQMIGSADTVHFILSIEELGNLASRLTQDAALLTASPYSPTRGDQ